MADKLTRIAIVSADRCKPKKCRQECKKSCPVVKIGESWVVCELSMVQPDDVTRCPWDIRQLPSRVFSVV